MADIIALGLLDAFRIHGIRVPEDMAIVTHDGLLAASSAFPSLTTIVPPRADMGRACIEVLLRAIAGESTPPCTCWKPLSSFVSPQPALVGRHAMASARLCRPLTHGHTGVPRQRRLMRSTVMT